MSRISPASILYDEAGNPVAVLNDGGVYRLRVDAKLTSGHGLALASNQTNGSQKSQVVSGANTLAIDGSGRAAVQNPPNLDVALSSRLADATFTARLNTLGQKTMANSAPVVIASNQSAVTMRGPDADGSTPTESPLLVAGFDGTNVRRIRTDQSGRALTRGFEEPTFVILANNIAVANAKSMLSILNTGESVILLREVWVINVQTAAVTGILGEFQLRRITGHSGGTDLTTTPGFLAHDTNDSVPSGLTARTGATVTGEAADPLHRRFWSTDEWGPGTLDLEGFEHAVQNYMPFYRSVSPMKPITMRTNQGISVRFNTNSTVGTFDIGAIVSAGVL